MSIIAEKVLHTDDVEMSGNAVMKLKSGQWSIDGVAVVSSAAELNSGDITAGGTVEANKVVVVDGSKDIGDFGVVGMATLNGVASALAITSPTITATATVKFNLIGMLDVGDVLAGGASNGNIIKKTLQASEDYTGTTAGLMVKNYGEALATVSSGEFTGLYVNVKGLHVSPGNNASLISAHVHGSNTTVIHAGLWLYGDLTNGVKASGSTLTTMIDTAEATSVTNFAAFVAGTDKAAEASVATPAGDTTHCIRVLIDGTPAYIPAYAAKTF